jgi:transcriptional repressor NrdR
MKCPYCSDENTQVVDTRENEDGDTVRRRRRCLSCDKRFTTYERVELQLPQVVKKNGSRTDYDRDKLKASMMLAMRKRRSPPESIDMALDRIEEKLVQLALREVASDRIGELVMRELKKLDKGGLHPFRLGVSQFRGRRRVFRSDPRSQEAAAAPRQALTGCA